MSRGAILSDVVVRSMGRKVSNIGFVPISIVRVRALKIGVPVIPILSTVCCSGSNTSREDSDGSIAYRSSVTPTMVAVTCMNGKLGKKLLSAQRKRNQCLPSVYFPAED